MKQRHLLVWIVIVVWLFGGTLLEAKRKDEPDVVVVQHILIGFKKTVRGKKLDRSKNEASELAQELLERAQAGEDFDAMVKEYTDDRYPGIYRLTNKGVATMEQSMSRDQVAFYFGDVSFRLAVGEVGLAKYHAGNCPFGYHIIKRLE
jgi:foldase protein PrsA